MRIDHVGVIVDNLEHARRFLVGMGMDHNRDLEIPGRVRASFYTCGEIEIEIIDASEPVERSKLAKLGVKTQTADPLSSLPRT
jgi:catechol 2,3-dioxygenase-like lactoylglutathione lyase family enzyme